MSVITVNYDIDCSGSVSVLTNFDVSGTVDISGILDFMEGIFPVARIEP